ncbi:cytochrome b-c1 complex subunit 1, mitochondrial-like [Manduca sexta]|uniref:Mitochondrial-processing peptidase subunit beta n=1 Tax=Manduca sexta TaxID=7130 RepID=A0A921YVW1_MANSE|nr:cytochrome b-c1 complex subunit 1, mitochondrial-like [Manduca sexta]KAG6446956.1 hypothetical protein O3G_MSEX004696 [Manduca sexta]
MLKAMKLLNQSWHPLKISSRQHPYPAQFMYFLRNQPPTLYSRLSNGLTVATEERECCNVCIGLYVDGGSRYESNFENGISHFFEHIAFKGTNARPQTVLQEQMSRTGARFKCFTTREMAVYFAECLCPEVPLVMDLLADCILNNSYLPAVIEQQKNIVYKEMMEHDNDVNEILYDYLHATAFQGTPLAQTVMGNSSNLYNFTDSTICLYHAKFFDPARMVLAAVGGITHDQIVTLASTYFTRVDPMKCIDADVYRYTGSDVRYRDDSLPLANCVIAVEAPCFCDEDAVPMQIAAEVVSGWDKSQPGGLDHGVKMARVASTSDFCDAYKAFYVKYKDTGLWGVQFMGTTLQLDDMVLTVQDEWMHMCNTISDAEVMRAKRQLKTKLLSKMESSVGTCHEIGRWSLYHGCRPPLHELITTIDHVYAKNIRETCTKFIYDKCPVVAAVGPTEALPDYNRIRAGMYWLRI